MKTNFPSNKTAPALLCEAQLPSFLFTRQAALTGTIRGKNEVTFCLMPAHGAGDLHISLTVPLPNAQSVSDTEPVIPTNLLIVSLRKLGL